jgi:AhpD family alkylhydroperoxidase
MNNAFLATGIRRSLDKIRYVSPVLPGKAEGLVFDVYDQAERDFGLVVAPVVMHSPAPPVLAASWALLRETLLAVGSVSRADKEVVAAAVSAGNACPYCVTVHSAAVRTLAPGQTPTKIAADAVDAIADPELRAMAAWARDSGQPGQGAPPASRSFPEIAGVAIAFHYLNRMVTLFLPESPLPSMTPKPIGNWVMEMTASAMVSPAPAPGAAIELLPVAPLPAEFSWAASAPTIAQALARSAATVDEAGKRAASPQVRELVLGTLDGWSGKPPGVSGAWADTAVAELAEGDRAAARLALLAALSPHQVRQADVQAYRQSGGTAATDEQLISLTAWASMAAARKVGSWLGQPSPDAGRAA